MGLVTIYLIAGAAITGVVLLGRKRTEAPTTRVRVVLSDKALANVRKLVDGGHLLDAITEYRALTGVSLAEAKHAIDELKKS